MANKSLEQILFELLEPTIIAVGGDIKKLSGLINGQADELSRLRGLIPTDAVTMVQVEEKISELRTALFGGNLDEAYDTFAEIAEKLKSLDGSIGAAITQKLSEFRTELDELKRTQNIDYLAVYRRAKGEEV